MPADKAKVKKLESDFAKALANKDKVVNTEKAAVQKIRAELDQARAESDQEGEN